MLQLSIAQFGYLADVADPLLHLLLLAGIILVIFEVAVFLGNLLGSRDREAPG